MDCHHIRAQDHQKIASQQWNLHQFSDCTKRTSAVNAQQQIKVIHGARLISKYNTTLIGLRKF